MVNVQFGLWMVFCLSFGRAEYYCETEGLFLDPDGDLCKDYYQCIYLQETWFYVLGACESNTILNSTERNCLRGQCQTDGSTAAWTIIPSTPEELSPEISFATTARPTPTTTSRPTTTKWTAHHPTTKLPTTTTIRPTSTKLTTTTKPTSSTVQPIKFKCTSGGYFGDPLNCGIYHACIENWGSWVHHIMPCPEGLVYCEGREIAVGFCGYTTDCLWIPCLSR